MSNVTRFTSEAFDGDYEDLIATVRRWVAVGEQPIGRCSSTVERPPCKRRVEGPTPSTGSNPEGLVPR